MTSDTLTIETHSPQATERLGRVLAGLVPTGTLIALRGELAAGKTCLVCGIAARLATTDTVSSPTFTIVNQYGESPKLYHVDLYRITAVEEILDLGYEDLFEPDGICVIEWAERAEALLPVNRVDILLEHAGPTSRRITITNTGILPPDWSRALAEEVHRRPDQVVSL